MCGFSGRRARDGGSAREGRDRGQVTVPRSDPTAAVVPIARAAQKANARGSQAGACAASSPRRHSYRPPTGCTTNPSPVDGVLRLHRLHLDALARSSSERGRASGAGRDRGEHAKRSIEDAAAERDQRADPEQPDRVVDLAKPQQLWLLREKLRTTRLWRRLTPHRLVRNLAFRALGPWPWWVAWSEAAFSRRSAW